MNGTRQRQNFGKQPRGVPKQATHRRVAGSERAAADSVLRLACCCVRVVGAREDRRRTMAVDLFAMLPSEMFEPLSPGPALALLLVPAYSAEV